MNEYDAAARKRSSFVTCTPYYWMWDAFPRQQQRDVTIIQGAQCDSLAHTSSVERWCGLNPGSAVNEPGGGLWMDGKGIATITSHPSSQPLAWFSTVGSLISYPYSLPISAQLTSMVVGKWCQTSCRVHLWTRPLLECRWIRWMHLQQIDTEWSKALRNYQWLSPSFCNSFAFSWRWEYGQEWLDKDLEETSRGIFVGTIPVFIRMDRGKSKQTEATVCVIL